jgi:hypothetical protein
MVEYDKFGIISRAEENFLEKIQENTTIIATELNVELIKTFFEANNLVPEVEVSDYRVVLFSEKDETNLCTEKFYNAICIKYPAAEEHIGILLLNLAAKHNGLNNMLIDYLQRLKVSPIVMNCTIVKPVTSQEVTDHFMTVVAPHLKADQSRKLPVRKSYVGT